jgi:hypothetical protein
MEIERKISLIHALAGAVLGVVFGLFLNPPELTLLSVLLLGFIISYPLKLLTMKFFNLSSEEFLLKEWLGKGYFIFVTVWIMVWVFFYNLR